MRPPASEPHRFKKNEEIGNSSGGYGVEFKLGASGYLPMRWLLSLITLSVLFLAGVLAPDRSYEPRASRVAVSVLPEKDANPRPQPSAEFWQLPENFLRERYTSEISDAEAVQIALRRGEEMATAPDDGGSSSPPPAKAEVEASPAALPVAIPASSAEPREIWRVVADRVNLRGGPGTDNPVVGGVERGETLVPVSALDRDWIEVERPSGETAWIFSKFLSRDEG